MNETTQYYLDLIVQYMCENHHPHTKIIIECDWWEIVEWIESQKITKHIKD